MLTAQQKRLRREYVEFEGVPFSEKTYRNKDIKLEYYRTIQDLYDSAYNLYEEEE